MLVFLFGAFSTVYPAVEVTSVFDINAGVILLFCIHILDGKLPCALLYISVCVSPAVPVYLVLAIERYVYKSIIPLPGGAANVPAIVLSAYQLTFDVFKVIL